MEHAEPLPPIVNPLALPPELWPLLDQLAPALLARNQRLCTAESCTGGLIAAACTALPGSSDWFERGYVTYSNTAKQQDLGVPADLISHHGAVSEAVARAMAEGARTRSGADWAVAVTGVAGPSGGSIEKPVGTVWFAWAGPQGTCTERQRWPGDRSGVRADTVLHAIKGVLLRLG